MLKKKTILKMFLIPLAMVMVVQAAISYGTLVLSGMSGYLNDYSVGIMEQIVKNRNLILENNMVHRWSDISGESQAANALLERIMEERELEADTFLEDESAKQEFMQEMLTPVLTMLRRNGVNGAYLVLADGLQEETEEGYKCSGFYFRDSDAFANPQDYSDLLMERGDYEFSHELKIPFDTIWTKKFRFQKEGSLDADNFFYQPYRAALDNPGAKPENLAYWGKLFCLEDNMVRDSYHMISYSMPLISQEGEVYGVLGVELSSDALDTLIPKEELNQGEESGYILAEYDGEGGLVPFYTRGYVAERSAKTGVPLNLKETGYPTLHQIEGEGGAGDSKSYYADVAPFAIYNINTPFENHGWALIGVQEKSSLFGISNRIMKSVLTAVFVALLFGIVSVFVLMKHLTKPISVLADWIRNVRRNTVLDYKKTDIVEVDDLYEAVNELTERQRAAENAALEEKERYRLALQSSTDIIFTYNIDEDTIDVYNISDGGKRESREEHLTRSVLENLDILEEDRLALERIFTNLEPEFKISFCYCTKKNGWQWMELSGKTILERSGRKSKAIGIIRNINEQKMREQQASRAARIDAVTGLYREEIGREIIRSQMEFGKRGCLVLLDVDGFGDINEQYGIDFGDAVLEELGRMISRLQKQYLQDGLTSVSYRAGGDEMVLWLCGFDRGETLQFLGSMKEMMKQFDQDGDFELSVTAAAIETGEKEAPFDHLLGTLCGVMAYAKKRRAGLCTFAQEIPETERLAESGGKRRINEIASTGDNMSLNLVTRAFNLFARGGKAGPVLAVLFAKIGERYGVQAVFMSEIRLDFNSSNLFRQWHAGEEIPYDGGIYHFNGEELAGCREKLASGLVTFHGEEGFEEGERRLLHIRDGFAGISIPLYDGGKLMGAITLIEKAAGSPLDEAAYAELQEIARIVETNVNRERYDLASRAKSEFLSRMSHEIRTPMNAIIGMTTIALKEQGQPEQVEGCLVKIEESSKYLLSLINDILDMSKIESGKMKLALGSGSLRELIDGTEDIVRQQMEEKHITYVQEVELSHCWLVADFMRLKQVLLNLLGNAVKFTPEGGTITLTIRENRSESFGKHDGRAEIYFAVTDTGIGISPEYQERIFDAFEQAENNTAAAYGGTGLGLSISSRLVHMMGGEIHLESQAGQGSCFNFTLGFQTVEEQDVEGRKRVEDETVDFTGCRVLLVEDNKLNTEIAVSILEMQGFEVETAENGLLGVERFEESIPGYYDLILMDIRMPVMDGLEAAETIRRLNRKDARTVPIIAMTANAFDEDMKKSIDSGMNGHLTKPVDIKELIRTAGEAIRESRSGNGNNQNI